MNTIVVTVNGTGDYPLPFYMLLREVSGAADFDILLNGSIVYSSVGQRVDSRSDEMYSDEFCTLLKYTKSVPPKICPNQQCWLKNNGGLRIKSVGAGDVPLTFKYDLVGESDPNYAYHNTALSQ